MHTLWKKTVDIFITQPGWAFGVLSPPDAQNFWQDFLDFSVMNSTCRNGPQSARKCGSRVKTGIRGNSPAGLHLRIGLIRFKQKNMNKKSLYATLGAVCIIAAIAMYLVGKNSSHLSELKDFFWVPLPLGAIFLLLSSRSDKQA